MTVQFLAACVGRRPQREALVVKRAKQIWMAFLLMSFLAPSLGAQEKVKFPIGVSSKVLGYGHLWAAWRRDYFEREGLDGLKTVVDIYAEQKGIKGPLPDPEKYVDQSYLK
jgi:hypothetical protein